MNTEKREMKKWYLSLFLLGLLIFGLYSLLFAQQSSKKGSVSKEIGGRVSGISKDFIAVAYKTDDVTHKEYEILLPINKNIGLTHVQKLDQIKVGDTVSVEFDEQTITTKEGAKTFRKGKAITFVAPAPIVPESEVLGAEEP